MAPDFAVIGIGVWLVTTFVCSCGEGGKDTMSQRWDENSQLQYLPAAS